MVIDEETPISDAGLALTDRMAAAEEAADFIFDARGDTAFEPRNTQEANAAVRRFAERYEALPEKIRQAFDTARDSGELLSSDRLQALAEIIQNADDAGASEVRFFAKSNELLVSHDGEPVRLQDILGFAIPWISTKIDQALPIGRFGIGLTTLRSLSAAFEVHCPPYHVRVGEPMLLPMKRPSLPPSFQQTGWTTIRVPIETGALSSQEVEHWINQWNDSSLVFLRSVSRIALLSGADNPIRELNLSRVEDGLVKSDDTVAMPTLRRQRAEASDGRLWAVYSGDFTSPAGVFRKGKPTETSTPVSVALPLRLTSSGMIHAGLPVAPTDLPLFVSAQFDPLTSRRDFANTEWNKALVGFVADLWTEAAIDLFSWDPKAAWNAMPISEASDEHQNVLLVATIEREITDRARRLLPSRLVFAVAKLDYVRLTQLAVETRPLESILTESEIAHLAGLRATLPSSVRDHLGRWRSVLSDWRSAGANLSGEVSVERALDLLRDDRCSADSSIALVAAALSENLGDRLLDLPWVIADDGRRICPPSGDSPEAVAAETSALAKQLGVVTLLHASHLRDEKCAREVLKWLEDCGALIDGSNEREVICRLASAGKAERQLDKPLTDEQMQALRNAFEMLDRDEQRGFGQDVGRAILVPAYTYVGERQKAVIASPSEAYLPRRIDRDTESLPVAAAKSLGPVWLSDEYAAVLRSPDGRRGLGAQRFLGLLGARMVPRVRRHRDLVRRYIGQSLGLSRFIQGGPETRRQELLKRGATYTLLDYECPDLQAVVEDISRERAGKTRRKRASAILTTLGRAWDRNLSEFAEVDSAHDYRQWRKKGEIRAFWLWKVGDVPWLDDESGTPRRPNELRIRTPGSIAIYGEKSSDFLHRDFSELNRNRVLTAIGVSGEPTRSELVERLRRLRRDSDLTRSGISKRQLKREVAVVYKALARDLRRHSRGDINAEQLRRLFQSDDGLVLTNLGWCTPGQVLAGDPIFGDYRAFAISVSRTESLWRALKLRDPSPDDCIKVIHRIARKRVEPDRLDRTILMETLRLLASHYSSGNTLAPSRLKQLALWTSKGWVRKRPVYVTQDPMLGKGIGDQLAVWDPGGDLGQFRPLLGPLRVEEICDSDTEIVDPLSAYDDDEATAMFRLAIGLLEEDLARNDRQLYDSITIPWARLSKFGVCVHVSLALSFRGISLKSGGKNITAVDAKLDTAIDRVFVRGTSVLPRVDGGGRALVAVFAASPRRVAFAWRAACDRADDGIRAQRLELARQRAEREAAEISQGLDERIAVFQDRVATNGDRTGKSARTEPTAREFQKVNSGAQSLQSLRTRRVLVDPSTLRLVDRQVRVEQSKNNSGGSDSPSKVLVEPRRVESAPRNRRPIAEYSALDRETVGMEIGRKLLSSNRGEIVDLRAQRGVGADAIDNMDRFYEFKVSAGAESDLITLTDAEFRRALTTPDYFLVVVSDIEGDDARPKVRIIIDPLKSLKMQLKGQVVLTGVHDASSLVYQFEQNDMLSENLD